MAKYLGHDWVNNEVIAEPLIQALDDGTRDAAQAVADLAQTISTLPATYVTYDGSRLRLNGALIPITGTGAGGITVVDNGDGTLSSSSTSIVDNGDGTLSA